MSILRVDGLSTDPPVLGRHREGSIADDIGQGLTLNDVLHVPKIRKNLVSGSLLSKKGFKLVFVLDNFILTKNGMYVGKGYMSNGLFKMNVMTVVPLIKNINNKNTSSAYMLESSNVWHGRLGHVN